jgi:hypothetical protein
MDACTTVMIYLSANLLIAMRQGVVALRRNVVDVHKVSSPSAMICSEAVVKLHSVFEKRVDIQRKATFSQLSVDTSITRKSVCLFIAAYIESRSRGGDARDDGGQAHSHELRLLQGFCCHDLW